MPHWEHYYASLADASLSLPRFGHTAVAVTDDANGSCQVVVYGGVGCHAGETAQTALGDVAVLQTDSRTWSAPDILQAPGQQQQGPGPRAFHSAVVVAAATRAAAAAAEGGASASASAASSSCMLVFGGHILTFDAEHNRKRRNFHNDIWRLDLAEWQWTQVAADASSPLPAKRDMSALLQLQGGQQLLLFGGRSEQGKALQDTWTYDVSRNMWQQLKPVGALPPARKMHALTQVGGGQVVLFGGEGDGGPLDDAWLLAGFGPGETLRWTQVKMRASPTPRFGHAMATVRIAAAAAAAGSSRRSSEAGSSSEEDAEPASPFEDAAAARALEGSDSGAVTDAGGAGAGSAPQQQQQQRVVVFGGCLDLSGFLSLNKNYVQTKEAWLLQLDQLTWSQLPQQQPPPAAATAAAAGSPAPDPAAAVAAAAPDWPCERMCHSMTGLPDGRLLVIGGRNKEGICRDMWLLDVSGEMPSPDSVTPQPSSSLALPPASPRPSTAGSTGSAAAGTAAASSKPSPRPGSQSLLQSLLGPVRARVPSQGLLARRDSSSQVAAATAVGAAAAGASSTPATSTPSSSQPASPKRSQQHQQQDAERLQPLDASEDGAAPAETAALGGSSSSSSLAPAAVAGGVASSSQQSLQALMDVSSGEFAKLLRNPAAYSAGAINKLSSSVTSTVSSLLVGKDGQPGPMLPRLPEALMRVAPNWAPAPFGMRGNGADSSSTSSSLQQQQSGVNMPALTPLRQHMGLALSGAAVQELKAPSHVLQGLAMLGQQLLTGVHEPGGTASAGGSFAASGSLPADVLVAAARQHLMSAEAMQLKLPHVALLLADYQQVAASYHAHMMLSRLSEGFSAAAAGASQAAGGAGQCGSAFLQRQPTDLLVHQVQALQAEYQQLLLQSAA